MLTREEKQEYLRKYIPMVDFFSQASGPNCEVVLRDFHEDSSEIIYIVHGEISGRKEKQSIKGLMLHKIMRKDYHETDFISNYLLANESDQKLLRASTYYIKKDGELCGLLCVNYDLTDLMRYRDFMNHKLLYGLSSVHTSKDVDEDDKHLDSIVEQMIEEEFLYWDRKIPLPRVDLEEKPILRLYERGVFGHKGTVSRVSELLNISVQSVYRYINAIEQQIQE